MTMMVLMISMMTIVFDINDDDDGFDVDDDSVKFLRGCRVSRVQRN